jgi:hypothetical protein
MTKLFLACLTLLLASCGLVTSQSIYEGFRTRQNVKDAGTQPTAEKLNSYEAYEKERAKLKPPDKGETRKPP